MKTASYRSTSEDLEAEDRHLRSLIKRIAKHYSMKMFKMNRKELTTVEKRVIILNRRRQQIEPYLSSAYLERNRW